MSIATINATLQLLDIYMYIYIYIYRERERERERLVQVTHGVTS